MKLERRDLTEADQKKVRALYRDADLVREMYYEAGRCLVRARIARNVHDETRAAIAVMNAQAEDDRIAAELETYLEERPYDPKID
jgi:hypothetical protein